MTDAHLEPLTPLLSAIPAADVRAPNLPVAVALQEAHDLLALVGQEKLRTRLTAVGLKPDLIEALGPALAAARQAQSQWAVIRDRTKTEAQREREERGRELRTQLLAACRWNLRYDPVASATLHAINEGEGLPDLIQDLLDIAHLIDSRPAAFELDTTFDAALQAETARLLAGEIEAGLSGERLRDDQEQARDLRDRAYTHLDEIVDEIRAAGRYAYRNDPDLRLRFGSHYLRRRRARQESRSAEPSTDVDSVEP